MDISIGPPPESCHTNRWMSLDRTIRLPNALDSSANRVSIEHSSPTSRSSKAGKDPLSFHVVETLRRKLLPRELYPHGFLVMLSAATCRLKALIAQVLPLVLVFAFRLQTKLWEAIISSDRRVSSLIEIRSPNVKLPEQTCLHWHGTPLREFSRP